MRYVLQAVLSNAQHPEYGQATIPFPIPNQNYDSTIELLGPWRSAIHSGRIVRWMSWTASIPS